MRAEKLGTRIRKEQIAQAALHLAATRGMQALSIAEVARSVGLVPSAIYRHFRSKEQILDSVVDLIRRRLAANTEAARAGTPDPLERLERLLMLHIRLIRENRGIPRVIFSEDLFGGRRERRRRVYRLLSSYIASIAAIVRDGQRRRRIRPDLDPHTVARMLVGIFQPAAILWHTSGGRFDVDGHASKAWRILRAAIANPAEPAGPPLHRAKRARKRR